MMYSSFSQFSRFPDELQIRIWSFAAREPQVVVVEEGALISRFRSDRTVRRRGHAPGNTIPGYFQACLESRKAALKHHTPMFTEILGLPMYFDGQNDILVLNDLLSFTKFFRKATGSSAGILEELTAVQNVVLRARSKIDGMDLLRLCATFGCLMDLTIHEGKEPFILHDTVHERDRLFWGPLDMAPEDVKKRWEIIGDIIVDNHGWVLPVDMQWKPPTISVKTIPCGGEQSA